MLAENTNFFTNYESYTVTVSNLDEYVTFDSMARGIKIINDGSVTVNIALNVPTGGSNTDIPIKAGEVFSENITVNLVHYVLASGTTSASLRIMALQ